MTVGDMLAFRRPANRPIDPETTEDFRDEVTALEAERAELIAAMRPVIARLAVYGVNRSPTVLAQAQQLAHLIERPARRTLRGCRVSAAERLASAFLSGVPEETWAGAYPFLHIDGELVQNILAADPTLAQDIADGEALRRASEASGSWTISNVRTAGRTVGYAAEAWSLSTGRPVKVLGYDDPDVMPPTFPTIAAAADACRAALEANGG